MHLDGGRGRGMGSDGEGVEAGFGEDESGRDTLWHDLWGCCIIRTHVVMGIRLRASVQPNRKVKGQRERS